MAELRMNVGGSSPAQPPVNQITLFAKSTDKRLYVKDDTGAEVKLVTSENTISDLQAQAPLTTTGGGTPTIAIQNATSIQNGAMSFQDKLKLDNATASNVGNQLVIRDSTGNATFNQVTASNFIGQASSVQTVPALQGVVTTNGSNNVTVLSNNIITNDNISSTAGISLTKLAILPTDRSNHTGTQLSSSISDFNSSVTNHLNTNAPIINQMIDNNAGIQLSKLETNPLDRSNHTGTQLASSISDFNTQVSIDVVDYLTNNPIDNTLISNTASIAFSKLEANPLDRANHTGTQLVSSISDFASNVPAALTGGNGIDDIELQTSGTINTVGTVNRIDTSSGSIDISSSYLGQTSIHVLGSVGTGSWEASPVEVMYGGTGSTTPGAARNSILNIETFTTSENLTEEDNIVFVDATSSLLTMTLPPASTKTKLQIKKIDSSTNSVVINVQPGDSIEGDTNYTLSTQYASVTLASNLGTDWYILSST